MKWPTTLRSFESGPPREVRWQAWSQVDATQGRDHYVSGNSFASAQLVVGSFKRRVQDRLFFRVESVLVSSDKIQLGFRALPEALQNL